MSQTLRRQTTYPNGSYGSRSSEESQESRSTAPTSFDDCPRASAQPAYEELPPIYSKHDYQTSPCVTDLPRSSVNTYASSASDVDLCLEPESYYPDPEYDVHEYRQVVEGDFRPTHPGDFANYFPSTKRLYIRHDDTTYDGNMNLRVDTEESDQRKGNVQLFHLRMQDLKKREFSLRRYERGSGREVCHSSRKYAKSSTERPTLTRSVSNALASFRKPEFKRTSSIPSAKSDKGLKGIQRSNSAYGSVREEDSEMNDFMSELKLKSPSIPTNTTKLEFSNYAHVDVKRRGKKSSKRYEFEYWGYNYTWRRVSEKYAEGKSVSYHLHRGEGPAIAHIVPELRSPSEIRAEDAAGGWVPPCSMWISDSSVVNSVTDVADVVIATGLVVLVDDCIKQHFRPKKQSSLTVALPLTDRQVEFVSPKYMMEHVFKRTSSSSTREREQRGSPLRHHSPAQVFY
ncbi:hypothetical protein BJ875DRAFT_39994 [Amylocarpus encephaloides]|uniref:Uncharacterized protein n=1 Tax=Amylocarpus encephaloides TaxID=45428 RepID=A0A9P7YSA7_9HELO|nr:hypothetical protein BJ875DRAFT_39994 [Amylocarpus encephaloides]